jgi:Tfp pilus assembly protein PilO
MNRIFPIASISLLILVILGGVFLWWPKYQEFGVASSDLAVKNAALKQKQDYFIKLNDLSRKMESYTEQISKIDGSLAEKIDIPALFNFMLNITAENGLILKDIVASQGPSPSGETASNFFPFSISVSGSYGASKNLLSALYQNSRLFEVDLIQFSSAKEEAKDMFDVSLNLSIPYYPGVGVAVKAPVTNQ